MGSKVRQQQIVMVLFLAAALMLSAESVCSENVVVYRGNGEMVQYKLKWGVQPRNEVAAITSISFEAYQYPDSTMVVRSHSGGCAEVFLFGSDYELVRYFLNTDSEGFCINQGFFMDGALERTRILLGPLVLSWFENQFLPHHNTVASTLDGSRVSFSNDGLGSEGFTSGWERNRILAQLDEIGRLVKVENYIYDRMADHPIPYSRMVFEYESPDSYYPRAIASLLARPQLARTFEEVLPLDEFSINYQTFILEDSSHPAANGPQFLLGSMIQGLEEVPQGAAASPAVMTEIRRQQEVYDFGEPSGLLRGIRSFRPRISATRILIGVGVFLLLVGTWNLIIRRDRRSIS